MTQPPSSPSARFRDTHQSHEASRIAHEREHLWFIINRAYQNIYGLNLPNLPAYQKTIFDAVSSLRKDARTHALSDKTFIQITEDIIRISDEHARLALQHQSRASNPVYLRETALDNAIEKEKYLQAIGANKPSSTIVNATDISTRMAAKRGESISSAEIMEIAYQQLSISRTKVDG